MIAIAVAAFVGDVAAALTLTAVAVALASPFIAIHRKEHHR